MIIVLMKIQQSNLKLLKLRMKRKKWMRK